MTTIRIGSLLILAGGLALACLGISGCGREEAQRPPPKPPAVKVAVPFEAKVTDYEEITGQTDAEKMVEVRAQVPGYLKKRHFKDGEIVKEGQLLFEIDPRLYEADWEKMKATIVQTEARVARLEADFQRARNLPRTAFSREDFDRVAGDLAEAKANVQVAKAQERYAKQQLD
jgi:RND family efflux transporter MFP subunit